MRWNHVWASSAALAAVMAVAAPAYAQSIVSTVRGSVATDSGAPVGGASVVITDTRNNRSVSLTTDANGSFYATNLESGGPYQVVVSSAEFQDQRVEDLYLTLSDTAALNFTLSGASTEEIVVVAARRVLTELAIGPSSVFNQQTLESFPSIGRDIRDVIRFDPRVRIDGTNGDAVQCGGVNNRFNSFTVDGVRNGDAFGLNASGFVNRNGLPVPFDAIRETAVEFAPFDVEYGQFTGCNINVVTKSGTNEFHGAAFAVFSSQSLTGSQINGQDVNTAPFRDFNWGASIGGPVIKDKLFFFAAYEETQDNNIQNIGPSGGGFASSAAFATVDQLEEIAESLSARGFETGGIASVLPVESRRILTRWDWNITEQHRLAFTYQRLREFETNPDDQSLAFGTRTLIFGNTFFRQGTNAETYSARLFSQWTDKFSTELRASRADIEDIQDPVGGGEAQSGSPLPRIFIGVQNDANGNGIIAESETGAVLAGPGFSRAANQGNFQVDQIRAKFDYRLGRHTFTGGYELDQLDVFNLFAQNATGTLVFPNLAAFEAGQLAPALSPTGVQFTNTTVNGNTLNLTTTGASGRTASATFQGFINGDINQAAAQFSRSVHSLFLQDEWEVTDALTILLGLRFDQYVSEDRPLQNLTFFNRFGIDNARGYEGLNAFLPRIGLTYDPGETLFGRTTFRAGAGIFSGGDPTVWFSNAFSNSGNLLSGILPLTVPTVSTAGAPIAGNCTIADLNVGTTGIPQIPSCLVNAATNAANSADGRVDFIDPDFELPTIIRGNFGLNHITDFGGAAAGIFDDWNVQLDVIVSRGRNSIDFVDISLQQIGTAIDGRPIFASLNPLAAGCNADLTGVRTGFTTTDANNDGQPDPLASSCIVTSTALVGSQDIIGLTNAAQGNRQLTFSTLFSKTFDYELFNRPALFNLNFGYAFNDAEDIQPGTSSVSLSNFGNIASPNFNNNPLATSNFETRHNVTLAAQFKQEFIPRLPTNLAFFFQARSGTPFTFTFNNSGAFGDSAGGEIRSNLLVPSAPLSVGAFTPFLTASGAAATVNGVPVGTFATNDPNFRLFGFVPAGGTPTPGNVTGTAAAPVTTPLNLAALNTFFANSGLPGGQIAPRNSQRSPWFRDLDFRLQQDLPTIFLPGPLKKIRSLFTVDIENLLNLIDDNRNVLRQIPFGASGNTAEVLTLQSSPSAAVNGLGTTTNPGANPLLIAAFSDTAFSAQTPPALFETQTDDSVWAVQFGLRFEF